MAVIIKRSGTSKIPNECAYGCCTQVYGKNTKKIRRMIKRSEKRQWQRETKEI